MPRDGTRIKGSPEQRVRARDALRDELLAAARTLGEEGTGYEKVTIRQVADRVGYTAPVVYEHFANKRDLLLAVIDRGFRDLANALARALDQSPRAGGALRAVAETYWTFAFRHRQLYRLMSSLADVPFGTRDTPPSAVDCFRLLKTAVAAGVPDHPANAYDGDAATDLVWAHLHGLTLLALDGRIKGGRKRAHDLLDQLVATHYR